MKYLIVPVLYLVTSFAVVIPSTLTRAEASRCRTDCRIDSGGNSHCKTVCK